MATATVVMPPVLTAPEGLLGELLEAARLGLDSELPSILGEIAASGTVPADRGVLTRAVANAAQPARIEGALVIADIIAAGEAAAYAAVQDLGRTAGKKMSWRVLFYGPGTDDWRGGWVNRARRDWVVEVAEQLRGLDAGKKGVRKKAAAVYEKRAAFIIARAVARAIRIRGMKGKQFLTAKRDEIAKRCTEVVQAEVARVLERWSA